jgi:hypothetical protein
MADVSATPGPKPVLLGVLKAWFDTLNTHRDQIQNVMTELAKYKELPRNKTGGKIKIGNLVFQEWKVNTRASDPLRLFGFFYGDTLQIAAIATGHKKGKYSGMTWDEKNEWAPDYQSSNAEVDSMGPGAFDDELLYQAARSKGMGRNWPSAS